MLDKLLYVVGWHRFLAVDKFPYKRIEMKFCDHIYSEYRATPDKGEKENWKNWQIEWSYNANLFLPDQESLNDPYLCSK